MFFNIKDKKKKVILQHINCWQIKAIKFKHLFQVNDKLFRVLEFNKLLYYLHNWLCRCYMVKFKWYILSNIEIESEVKLGKLFRIKLREKIRIIVKEYS